MLKTSFYLTGWSLLFCCISSPVCNGATLVWNKNTENDLAGYTIYYGTSPKYYSAALDVGNITAWELEDLGLREKITCYIAITAYDISGNESAFSREVNFFADDYIDTPDNCPETYNPSQKDSYPPGGNGIGDACECEGDFDRDGDVDALDALILLNEHSRNSWNRPCTSADPCFTDIDCNGSVDGTDIKLFMEDFGRNVHNNPCPYHKVEGWCDY